MKKLMINSTRHPARRRHSAAGFTLVEMMTSVGLGLLVLTSVSILYINGNECFMSMGNYQNLDRYSCNCLDVLSREIRNSTAVASYTTNQLVLTNAILGQSVTVTYNSGSHTLVLKKTGQPAQTNLLGCDSWSFSLYNRAPNISTNTITFNATTSAANCKLIQMNWKCSRTILGSKLNTESVQTAQIVLRNKTQ